MKRKREVEQPFDFDLDDRDIPEPPKAIRKWMLDGMQGVLASLAEGQWMTGITDLAALRWSVNGFDGDALALGPDEFFKAVSVHLRAEAGELAGHIDKHGKQRSAKDWQKIRIAWLEVIERLDAEAARIAELPEREWHSPRIKLSDAE